MSIIKTPALPSVGFVSLGCPKATVDSEHILTRLRAEGYEITGSYDDADLVVVNTCGFIDAAVEESLDAIGEALNENGKVIVTGCLGAKDGVVLAATAGALNVRLGGEALNARVDELAQQGFTVDASVGNSAGTPGREPEVGHLRSVVGLVWRSVVVWMLLLALLTLARLLG